MLYSVSLELIVHGRRVLAPRCIVERGDWQLLLLLSVVVESCREHVELCIEFSIVLAWFMRVDGRHLGFIGVASGQYPVG